MPHVSTSDEAWSVLNELDQLSTSSGQNLTFDTHRLGPESTLT